MKHARLCKSLYHETFKFVYTYRMIKSLHHSYYLSILSMYRNIGGN